MKLYLLRHGVAAPRDLARYPQDLDRPLTPGGRSKMRKAARAMGIFGCQFDLLLTSPLARARQTARIVSSEIPRCPSPRVHRPLAPGGSTEEILAGIPDGRRIDSALLVGHEPDLTRLAADLLAGPDTTVPIVLRKGGLIRIDFDGASRRGAGQLVLLATPRLLRLVSERATH